MSNEMTPPQRLLLIVGVVLCVFATSAQSGPYEDCILQNMKGVQAQAAACAIMRACREKVTPKKCRDANLKAQVTSADNDKKPQERDWGSLINWDQFVLECLKACASSSWWDRTFGECATD